MTKKLLSLLLALIMLCSVMGGMAYADDDTDEAERSADIVILFTSDVHCGIDQGFGYAGGQSGHPGG